MRRPRCRGFTLLEVLVAAAVLGIALVTLLGLHARNLRLTAEARDMTIAGVLAARIAADVRARAFPEPGTSSGTFTEDETEAGLLGRVYGGTQSTGFVWHRTVDSINLRNVRRVRIEVARRGDTRTLAAFDFLVRRGGP